MVKIIEQKIPKFIKMGSDGKSRGVIIPSTWREIMNLKDNTETIMRLKETQFGFAIEIFEPKKMEAETK